MLFFPLDVAAVDALLLLPLDDIDAIVTRIVQSLLSLTLLLAVTLVSLVRVCMSLAYVCMVTGVCVCVVVGVAAIIQ